MTRFLLCACAALILTGASGCGPGFPVPAPVRPTPTAVRPRLAPRLPPPPPEVVKYEAPGLCGHADLVPYATFYGEFNASDGAHYHGWQPPRDEPFWARC